MRSIFYLLIFAAFCSCALSCERQKKIKANYTDYDRGLRYWYYDINDSAFLMFNRYINNPDDTFKKGSSYKYIGEIQWNNGDLYDAQQSLISALKILDPNNADHRNEIGNTYHLLGNVNYDLEEYDKAIEFYDKALTFFKKDSVNPNTLNGKANALQKKGKYEAALVFYDSALVHFYYDSSITARLIDNKAKTKWLRDSDAVVLPEFWLALKIRTLIEDNPGIVTSYSHLSDYFAKLNPDSALWYAKKMQAISIENKNPDDIIESTDKLILLSPSPDSTKRLYAKSIYLRDSLQFVRNSSQNRFAGVKFEVEKKKADDRDFQQKISKQRLFTYLSISLALCSIASLMVFFNNRRKRIKKQSEIAIRDSKLKLSRKVHDVVANGLYRIMNELEHGKTIEKEPLIDKIEGLYEKSRDISYEDTSSGSNVDYNKQLHELIMSYDNENTKVVIVGDDPALWSRVAHADKKELQLVLEEVLVNMKKHSHAKKALVTFGEENGQGYILYKDDGTGFSPAHAPGNGLRNMVNRIESINGDITFGKSEKGGVSITIRFPLQSYQI